MDMRFAVLWVLSVIQLCRGQKGNTASDKGLLLNRIRPQYQQQSNPCWGGYDYDSVDDIKGRKLLLAAGAAIGGAALGYHFGMSQQQNQPIINNNIYNEYPPPCVVVQSGGHPGGGGGGILGGGGLLGNHPILSNIIQGGGGLLSNVGNGGGGLLNNVGGGGGGNRQGEINWNRAIRQFNRLIRPITRVFK